MVNKDLVSVIMPCHNGEKYIGDAIESVLKQSYSNLELLVIDDCSKDNSISIIKSFVEKDPRVKFFVTETSKGLPANPRNIGIKNASGRYIAFLDCDDMWLPNKLEHQIPLFGNKHVAIVQSNYIKMNSIGMPLNRIIKLPEIVGFSLLLRTNCIGTLTAVYDTAKLGKIYQKEIRFEDYLLWLEITKKGFCCMNTNTIEAFYRLHENSFSRNKLKAMQWHWIVLRKGMNVSFVKACFYFFIYAIKAIPKFFA